MQSLWLSGAMCDMSRYDCVYQPTTGSPHAQCPWVHLCRFCCIGHCKEVSRPTVGMEESNSVILCLSNTSIVRLTNEFYKYIYLVK